MIDFYSNRQLHITLRDHKQLSKKVKVQDLTYTRKYLPGREVLAFVKADSDPEKGIQVLFFTFST